MVDKVKPWFMVNGLAHGSRIMVLIMVLFMVLCMVWFMVQFMVWFLVHGSWFMVRAQIFDIKGICPPSLSQNSPKIRPYSTLLFSLIAFSLPTITFES